MQDRVDALIQEVLDTPIAEALRKRFKGISVSGEYVNAPPKFPYVSIVEQDNYMSANRLDSSDREKFSTLMYEVNVYSDKAGSKKSACREIMGVIDEMLYKRNFTRISLSPVPNMENGTIYRLVARYRAETDGGTIYRR